MHALGHGDCLRDARQHRAGNGVASDSRRSFASAADMRNRLDFENVPRPCVVHELRAGRQTPAGALQVTGVGEQRFENVLRQI